MCQKKDKLLPDWENIFTQKKIFSKLLQKKKVEQKKHGYNPKKANEKINWCNEMTGKKKKQLWVENGIVKAKPGVEVKSDRLALDLEF